MRPLRTTATCAASRTSARSFRRRRSRWPSAPAPAAATCSRRWCSATRSRGFFSAFGGDQLLDVTKDLGTSWDITTNMAIKLVPGGHPHHAAAEAAANAAIAGDVDPRDVASIVLSSAKYRTLRGPKHPTDLIAVAHSPAYFIAAAIADQGYGCIHAAPEKGPDPCIARLIPRITAELKPPPDPER